MTVFTPSARRDAEGRRELQKLLGTAVRDCSCRSQSHSLRISALPCVLRVNTVAVDQCTDDGFGDGGAARTARRRASSMACDGPEAASSSWAARSRRGSTSTSCHCRPWRDGNVIRPAMQPPDHGSATTATVPTHHVPAPSCPRQGGCVTASPPSSVHPRNRPPG